MVDLVSGPPGISVSRRLPTATGPRRGSVDANLGLRSGSVYPRRRRAPALALVAGARPRFAKLPGHPARGASAASLAAAPEPVIS
ncbi:hypothetical protein BH18ACT15_BH18ACT15_06130 [soil metagenome]